MSIVELSHVTKRFGGIVAVDDCSFAVEKGQIISLLGPSGCGKTTTLRLIAGFEDPDEGAVRIAGQDMRGKRPYERNVGLLFQDYALFPHMSVTENVGYGLRRRGFPRDRVGKRIAEVMALVKLQGFENRRPNQLSGGQQQRVALARALATSPEVMLLDEPLSALDAKLRQELRAELKEILRRVGTTSIVVTHDQEEAMSLADTITVMNRSRIVQRGTPTEIYDRPANKFVAEFIGRSNWFSGALGSVVSGDTRVFRTDTGEILTVLAEACALPGHYEVCVRPERIKVIDLAERPDPAVGTNARMNVLHGTLIDSVPLGPDIHLMVLLGSGQRISVLERSVGQPVPQVGRPVALRFSCASCIMIAATGRDDSGRDIA
jgi:putative spermidine/putrescine transport system ATP-binding protein/putrescine transport system ATP-binding protein